jgi:hypothetical protein
VSVLVVLAAQVKAVIVHLDRLLPVAVVIQETGIKLLQEMAADLAEVAQILPPTVVVCVVLAEQELQGKDFPVVVEYATTTTAKIHTTAAVVAEQADQVLPHKTQIKDKQHMEAQERLAIS